MRLENLYPNFAKLCEAEQIAYIASYRLRRAEDMSKPAFVKKSKAPASQKLELTEEETAVMKLLGLKKKDILALRETAVAEVVEETGNLFADDTFEEED